MLSEALIDLSKITPTYTGQVCVGVCHGTIQFVVPSWLLCILYEVRMTGFTRRLFQFFGKDYLFESTKNYIQDSILNTYKSVIGF